MLLHEYDRITREYKGCRGEAYIDPIRSKREGKIWYALPLNCTIIEPPELEEHETAIFNIEKQEWYKVKDYRGIRGYNKKTREEVVITELGELPDYFCEELPVLLQDLKIQKIQEVNRVYNDFIQIPIKFKNNFYSISYREVIRTELNNIGDLDVISLDLENGDVVVKTKEEAEEILKYLDLWNLLLPLRKAKIIASIKKVRSKNTLEQVDIDFDISKEVKSLMDSSPEEIRQYVLGDTE